MSKQDQNSAQSGFALFVVLMFLMLAAAIATPFFSTARDYAFIQRNVSQTSRERSASEGLLSLSAQRYFELAGRQERLPAQVSCKAGNNGETMLVSFQNHLGLIDLNAASSQLLRLGFVALGVDDSAAMQLATVTESYRSPEPAGRPGDSIWPIFGGLKNAPFESSAELLDFGLPQGVDAEALGGVFTVHAGVDGIDEGFASPHLAKALGATSAGGALSPSAGATPVPAVTVTVHFVMSNGRHIHGQGTYVPEGATIKRHGPARTGRIDAFPVADVSQAPPADCARFYDERALAISLGLLT